MGVENRFTQLNGGYDPELAAVVLAFANARGWSLSRAVRELVRLGLTAATHDRRTDVTDNR
jgi:hypothetical protein